MICCKIEDNYEEELAEGKILFDEIEMAKSGSLVKKSFFFFFIRQNAAICSFPD
jgi:hypothetical protein